MFIKSNCALLPSLIHIPDNCVWRIEVEKESENGYDECSLCLYVDTKRFYLADAEDLCSGRPSLPEWAVCDLHEEIVDSIAEQLNKDPSLNFIDVSQLEAELIESKYLKDWSERGYIEIDENGHW